MKSHKKYKERIVYSPLLILIFFLFAWGCDQGLEPPQEPPPPSYGFEGVIYFQNWFPIDSIKSLRVVAFQNYPPGDIAVEYFENRLRFSDDLISSHGADSIPYTVILNPMYVDSIPYIAVGQQFGENQFQDWRMVGIYYSIGDSSRPGTVKVFPDSIVSGINIYVDFNNPPPQP
ncbi:MAG: hypothetical protein QME52_07150 [Bacteroidota bacterium]|nr:hypothetical protein [Bacteroidota bacterium]